MNGQYVTMPAVPASLLSPDSWSKEEFLQRFGEFLRLDVAHGRAAADTMATYLSHIRQFLLWCREEGLQPEQATVHQLKVYRQYLWEKRRYKVSTIALNLTALRRFYAAAVSRGILKENPAAEVYAGEDRRARLQQQSFLTAADMQHLLSLIPKEGEEALRAKAILVLMALQGLRTVEIHRANIEDVDWNNGMMLVHGKKRDGYVYLREDVLAALDSYAKQRRPVQGDTEGTPLFVSISRHHNGGRLSRCGIRDIVDHWFQEAKLKKPGKSCHLLRHTCGTLLYQETKDLRIVQETLRHASPTTTAKYAHLDDQLSHRYTSKIPIQVD